jgi:hypothetical protein
MKTKNLFRVGILVIALAGFMFTGCKKDKSTDSNINTQSMQQLTKDEVTVTKASDDALNDANTVLSGGTLKSTDGLWPCNATIDSTTLLNDSITYHITYHGLNCPGNRTRTGQVEITKKVGQPWGAIGAATIVKLINLQVTKVATNKSLTLNGRKVFTNVSGGYLWQLGSTMTAIVHKAEGYMTATFDDGTSKVWNISRQRTFTGTIGGQLILTIDGFGSADGYSNLVVWGTNRNGEAFYTQITQSIVMKATCDWDPVSGIKIHQIPADNKSATVTYGYDNNYQLVTNGDCPTYYKVDWVKGTHSGTFFLPLP